MRSIFFRRDSPCDTTLYDSETNELLYTVATQQGKETVTRVQNADGDVIASWIWKKVRSDIITLGSFKPISVGTWLDKSISPNQDTVTLKDHLKRKFKWKGNAPGMWSLELYSETGKKPIVQFHKSHPVTDETGNKTIEPARLELDGLALEIQDIVVISFLVLEKTRRNKGASQMNLEEGSKTGFVGQVSYISANSGWGSGCFRESGYCGHFLACVGEKPGNKESSEMDTADSVAVVGSPV